MSIMTNSPDQKKVLHILNASIILLSSGNLPLPGANALIECAIRTICEWGGTSCSVLRNAKNDVSKLRSAKTDQTSADKIGVQTIRQILSSMPGLSKNAQSDIGVLLLLIEDGELTQQEADARFADVFTCLGTDIHELGERVFEE